MLGSVQVYQAQTGAAVKSFSVQQHRHSPPCPPSARRIASARDKDTLSFAPTSSPSPKPLSSTLATTLHMPSPRRDPHTGKLRPVVVRAALDHKVRLISSCHIMPYHIISYHIMLYHVMQCN